MLSASETDAALKKAIASHTYELKGIEAAFHEVCWDLFYHVAIISLNEGMELAEIQLQLYPGYTKYIGGI